MKFKIREGYVLNRVDAVTLGDGKVVERATNAYEGEIIDLDAEKASQHLHMLEPADKDAQKFLADKAVPSSAQTSAEGGQLPAGLAELLAAAVKEGIAAGMAAVQAAQVATPAEASASSDTSNAPAGKAAGG